ncbi:MAG TPA: PilZ domain-containing protein [Bryobacteraceae bacterium]|nr:PilZ domain-containing protein [Bryobacteraceae bacterium]
MKETAADIRRHQRIHCDTRGRAMWTDRSGRDKWALVRVYDLSEAGVRLELPEPVEARSVISISSDDMKVKGQATVRFCRKQGSKYVVGAEFVGGTAWKPARPKHN